MWQQVSDSDVRITPVERKVLDGIADSDQICAEILGNVVGEFRDTIAAAGTPLGDEGTIPDLVRTHVINRTRWLWVCEFPQLRSSQTAERKALNDAAETALAKISSRDLKVPPGDNSAADQTPSPSFGKKCPPLRFTPRNQDG